MGPITKKCLLPGFDMLPSIIYGLLFVKMITPSLFSKAFRRKDSSDEVAASIFEEFCRNDFGRFIAAEAIERLLKETHCPWILFSYSSGGRAAAGELNEAIEKHGKLVEIVEVDYKKNVMSSMK